MADCNEPLFTSAWLKSECIRIREEISANSTKLAGLKKIENGGDTLELEGVISDLRSEYNRTKQEYKEACRYENYGQTKCGWMPDSFNG